jgi:hypothetical protein
MIEETRTPTNAELYLMIVELRQEIADLKAEKAKKTEVVLAGASPKSQAYIASIKRGER